MTSTVVRDETVTGSAPSLRLAARAANLAERTAVVRQLERQGRLPGAQEVPPADAFQTWRNERTAGKLADKFGQEALHRNHPPRHTKDDIAHILEFYRRFEETLALEEHPGDQAEYLEHLQESWLPTYRAALHGYVPPATKRYDRLAVACAPFLELLETELRAEVALAGTDFAPQVVEELGHHLLGRFELAVAWALEAEANVHLSRTGQKPETGDYLAFLDATFRDESAYHEFYLRFPVLGRWLAEATGLALQTGRDLITRLDADGDLLAIERVTAVRPGKSDYHAGGRTVVMVEVETAQGPTSYVYKPRDISAEAAVQKLLGILSAEAGTGSAGRRVWLRPGYGYEEMIPAGRNHVETLEQARQVYRDLGAHLATFYVLGGTDLHLENIIVADGHAHVCDCETVLGVLPTGQSRPAGTLLDSVFKTALLEWPSSKQGEGTMRISGYAGGEAYEMPVPVATVNDTTLSFEAGVRHRAGIRVEPDAANRVFLNGELVRPEDHVADIIEGFGQVYAWFEADPKRTAGLVRELFGRAPIRFINWGTQIYSQLLMASRHPRCLTDPLEVDWLFNTMRTFPRTWDADGVLADRELRSMWRLDVPIFTAPADAAHLVHDHDERLDSPLDASPAEFAAGRIARLDRANREQQHRYIAASLSAAEISNPDFVETCLDHAARIGEHLCEQLRPDDAPAPWESWDTSRDIDGDQGMARVDVEADLYLGSAGIALFLAHLDAARPDPRFRAAARRGLDHALREVDLTRPGAFQGVGGLVYLLNHLGKLWDDASLTATAREFLPRLAHLAEIHDSNDILTGRAGLVPVLLGLAPDPSDVSDPAVALAHRCGELLLDRAVEGDHDVLSWPLTEPDEATGNLTGFAHGAGGIGWALILLGTTAGRDDWTAAGRRAFAYEASHYDGDVQDWYDLRRRGGGVQKNGRHYANAWCNGAAGIGLSRISAWHLLGGDDELMLREAHQGLAATLRNLTQLRNDTLCHGRSGNAELLLRFALLKEEPAFQLEANVQVQSLWRSVDEALAGTAEGTAGFFPGLMLGLSGFGLHLLRLARPDQVPSVLLLDPPNDL
ncbi:type 2 lanthipeptide synthetase LanM family protein [Kineosporia sp. NBRC 101731]|uniref:type 2 lanthipeptide synthetase LanM family protein n=1 Tax=Kineosporia sp. NBRC 101731 TaxID=3032199 RepID=UPI0024A330B8|nr:type 2 lanthipeptide synthetase LanM family protein [Kineosporia sp. NBRC 101731]GLY28765.1 lanthionine synthetase [Kineosporia sp. NBRC 101731]